MSFPDFNHIGRQYCVDSARAVLRPLSEYIRRGQYRVLCHIRTYGGSIICAYRIIEYYTARQ